MQGRAVSPSSREREPQNYYSKLSDDELQAAYEDVYKKLNELIELTKHHSSYKQSDRFRVELPRHLYKSKGWFSVDKNEVLIQLTNMNTGIHRLQERAMHEARSKGLDPDSQKERNLALGYGYVTNAYRQGLINERENEYNKVLAAQGLVRQSMQNAPFGGWGPTNIELALSNGVDTEDTQHGLQPGVVYQRSSSQYEKPYMDFRIPWKLPLPWNRGGGKHTHKSKRSNKSKCRSNKGKKTHRFRSRSTRRRQH